MLGIHIKKLLKNFLMYKTLFKRLIDFLGAFVGLIILSPFFLIIMTLLLFTNKSNPFFLQMRPGKNERLFKIIKFKTMNDEKDENGNLLPDSKRLTKIGRLVRKTSLDEIPQLINVLVGDMSFIGPRPLLCNYLPFYSSDERLRHTVRSGITGLAQVKGRNTLHWDERLALDIVYVNNMSFFLDCKILFVTVLNVLNGKNIVIDPGSELENLDVLRKNIK